MKIGEGIVYNDTNKRLGIGDPVPASPDSELHIKAATPEITLQRTSNSNDSVIDFQGSGGSVGAKIVHTDDGDANSIVFHTHDASTTQERLKITGGSATTKISGSAVSTGSFGSLVVADKVQGDLTIGDSLTSNKGATFNAAQSSAHDFRALSANKNYMLYVDANKDKVGIGFQNPEGQHLSSSLHIAGDLTTDSHITGSGNINTTAGRVYEQGTSVIDHATAMAIVFGG